LYTARPPPKEGEAVEARKSDVDRLIDISTTVFKILIWDRRYGARLTDDDLYLFASAIEKAAAEVRGKRKRAVRRSVARNPKNP
jgi:hypothetical protein